MPRQMLSQEDYQFICSAAKGLVAENSAMERETQGLLLLQYIGLPAGRGGGTPGAAALGGGAGARGK